MLLLQTHSPTLPPPLPSVYLHTCRFMARSWLLLRSWACSGSGGGVGGMYQKSINDNNFKIKIKTIQRSPPTCVKFNDSEDIYGNRRDSSFRPAPICHVVVAVVVAAFCHFVCNYRIYCPNPLLAGPSRARPSSGRLLPRFELEL